MEKSDGSKCPHCISKDIYIASLLEQLKKKEQQLLLQQQMWMEMNRALKKHEVELGRRTRKNSPSNFQLVYSGK